MIQRIQSVWLFIAAMLNGLLFLFPLYRFNHPMGGMSSSPWEYESVKTYVPLFILAAAITVLPLVAIFMFGNRKRQKGMVWVNIIAIAGFISLMLMRVSNLKNATPPAANLEYVLPGVLVTVGALVFLVLALQGIRKDEKLIKSLDRLR